MAWEWSHTAEGVANALKNIAHQSDEWLKVVYGEWTAWIPNWDMEDFSAKNYNLGYRLAEKKILDGDRDLVIEDIQTMMERQALSDRGGFHAWACPYGCHIVSFDAPQTFLPTRVHPKR
jgi:hypothetical protein